MNSAPANPARGQGPAIASGPIEPGNWVRNPSNPDWGAGQVQSKIGDRVTINFENAGKMLINVAHVSLQRLDGPPPGPGAGRRDP